MSNESNERDAGHDEVFELLPWYANRSLPSDQRGRVSRHVNRCEECQAELQFLNAMNDSVQHEADAHHHEQADVDASLAKVMGRIDAQPARQPMAQPGGAPWVRALGQRLAALFPFPDASPATRWGGAALAGVLVAVLAVQLSTPGPSDDYTVLSSPESLPFAMRLSVQLSASTNEAQAHTLIRAELDRLGDAVELQVGDDGAFVVTLPPGVSVEAVNEVLLGLEAEERIERVRVLP